MAAKSILDIEPWSLALITIIPGLLEICNQLTHYGICNQTR